MISTTTRTAKGGIQGPVKATCLQVIAGPDRGARYELRSGTALVGTQPSCSLVLTDPTVSRQHLRLILSEEGLSFSDLGSRNGVAVNGVIAEQGRIPMGARLKLGDTELQVLPLDVSQDSEGDEEFFGFVGRSLAARDLVSQLERIAPGDKTVLLVGETGTGKEVVARALHQASGRTGAFVTFDCGGVAPNLAASELFGHLRGAFTDATGDRQGACDAASGGTLFLDEIAELEPTIQPSLLRVLERKECRPIGGSDYHPTDIRVIAATHKDLEEEVRQGRFREDLFFRLAVIQVRVPPLRERADDLPLLARRLLRDTGHSPELYEAGLSQLKTYAWPGNVRELRNVLTRATTLGEWESSAKNPPPSELPLDYRQAREAMISRFEREYLHYLLAKNDHNVSKAARSASIARGHLYRLLKKNDLV